MIVQCFQRVAVPLGRRVPTARDTEIRAAEPLDFETPQQLLGSDDKFTRYRGSDKSLARLTSSCILFDG
jgi:hypothetical protein